MNETKFEFHVIITQNTDAAKWQADHTTIADHLAGGWTIQSSHAFPANGGIVVYYFLTRITPIETPQA